MFAWERSFFGEKFIRGVGKTILYPISQHVYLIRMCSNQTLNLVGELV